MVDVSLLMPCKGRVQQTLDLLPRLHSTAGKASWELICITDDDREVYEALNNWKVQQRADWLQIIGLDQRVGYWKALAVGSQVAQGRLLANIANDVLPGRNWIQWGVETFDKLFNYGVVGWNDGLCWEDRTGHLLCDRLLLEDWYGKDCWPTFYDHLYGDTEICHRAMEEEIYAINKKAVLFHNHHVLGKAIDPVYAKSYELESVDRALFRRREANGWKH